MLKRHEGLLVYLSITLLGLGTIMYLYEVVSTPRVVEPEYQLEIINQDTVVIQNIESGRSYKIHIDSIQATLQTDNL